MCWRLEIIGCDPHDVVEIDRRMDRACHHNWFAKAPSRWPAGTSRARRPGGRCTTCWAGPGGRLACRFSHGRYEPERVAAASVVAGLHDHQGQGGRQSGRRHRARPHRARGDRSGPRADDRCQLRLGRGHGDRLRQPTGRLPRGAGRTADARRRLCGWPACAARPRCR